PAATQPVEMHVSNNLLPRSVQVVHSQIHTLSLEYPLIPTAAIDPLAGCPLRLRMQWAKGFSPRRTVDPLQKRATVTRSNGHHEQRVPLRLRRPHLREASADFGLNHLVTASMNNPASSQSI